MSAYSSVATVSIDTCLFCARRPRGRRVGHMSGRVRALPRGWSPFDLDTSQFETAEKTAVGVHARLAVNALQSIAW